MHGLRLHVHTVGQRDFLDAADVKRSHGGTSKGTRLHGQPPHGSQSDVTAQCGSVECSLLDHCCDVGCPKKLELVEHSWRVGLEQVPRKLWQAVALVTVIV